MTDHGLSVVVAGLDPATHTAAADPIRTGCGMDAMVEPWHDNKQGSGDKSKSVPAVKTCRILPLPSFAEGPW